jgi:hypothetical protein
LNSPSGGIILLVIAGLDPAIHLLRTNLARKMDPRVKHGVTALALPVFADQVVIFKEGRTPAVAGS